MTNQLIDFVKTQIPFLMIMMRDGINYEMLLVVIGIPLIIILFSSLSTYFWRYYTKWISRKYEITIDEVKNANRCDTFKNLSNFLSDYYPETLRSCHVTGSSDTRVKNADGNHLHLFRLLSSPSKNYSSTITLTADVINKLKKIGLVLKNNPDVNNLINCKVNINFYDKNKVEHIDDKKIETAVNYALVSASNHSIVRDFLDIVNNYEIFEKISSKKFILRHFRYIKTKDFIDIRQYDVNVKKTFDNIFLSKENHKLIKSTIDTWQLSKKMYKKRGIAHKLGYLLVGAPGCGKTSTIYAIARYTKKHVYSIDLNNISNDQMYSIGQVSDGILLIDDADAYEILHQRKNKHVDKIDDTNNGNEKELSTIEALIKMKGDSAKVKHESLKKAASKYESSTKLTLDTVLNLLDGNIGLRDCIVIMTSNHPELLDRAVIRPGRIDHQINFNKCRIYEFEKIIKYYFEDHPAYNSDFTKIYPDFYFKDDVLTLSEITNTIILPNEHNPIIVLEIVTRRCVNADLLD